MLSNKEWFQQFRLRDSKNPLDILPSGLSMDYSAMEPLPSSCMLSLHTFSYFSGRGSRSPSWKENCSDSPRGRCTRRFGSILCLSCRNIWAKKQNPCPWSWFECMDWKLQWKVERIIISSSTCRLYTAPRWSMMDPQSTVDPSLSYVVPLPPCVHRFHRGSIEQSPTWMHATPQWIHNGTRWVHLEPWSW